MAFFVTRVRFQILSDQQSDLSDFNAQILSVRVSAHTCRDDCGKGPKYGPRRVPPRVQLNIKNSFKMNVAFAASCHSTSGLLYPIHRPVCAEIISLRYIMIYPLTVGRINLDVSDGYHFNN